MTWDGDVRREGGGRFTGLTSTPAAPELHGQAESSAGFRKKLHSSGNIFYMNWSHMYLGKTSNLTQMVSHSQTLCITNNLCFRTVKRTQRWTDNYPSEPVEGVRGHHSHPSRRPRSSPVPASFAVPAYPWTPPRRPARGPWWAGWSWDRAWSGNNTVHHCCLLGEEVGAKGERLEVGDKEWEKRVEWWVENGWVEGVTKRWGEMMKHAHANTVEEGLSSAHLNVRQSHIFIH